MSKNWKEYDALLSSETNQEIKKLIRRKMKAGVPAGKIKKAVNDWRSCSTRELKRRLKKELRAL